MGRKAKKRKQRLEEMRSSMYRSHDEIDAEEKVREFMESPDYQLMYMDSTVPIWVFSNQKTREFITIGHRPAVVSMGEAFDRVLEEAQQELVDKASLN